jgi:antitoxin component YwqK of YwqJK toxin-antitoxin module
LSGQYQLDQPSGVWRKYNTKGVFIQEFRYKNGFKNGWVINFNENQEIVHKELYKNGELLIGDVRVKYLETCKSKGVDPND